MHLILSSRIEKGGFRSPLRAAHQAAMKVTKHVQAAVAYVSTIDKRDAFCGQLYYEENLLLWRPPQLLKYLLFDGPVADIPSRLFECLHAPHKIAGLDVSSLGELIGWALPNDYPPRNDRTNKALRALGWDVAVRSPNRDAD